jgi:hypothetical protein
LRPLRAEAAQEGAGRDGNDGRGYNGERGGLTAALRELRGERSVIAALYAAKIEATRHGVLPRDRMAAIRALIEERRAAMRAITERKELIVRIDREKRQAKQAVAERAREQKPARPEARDEARPR